MLSSTSTIFMHFMAEMLILTDIFHFDSNNGCFKNYNLAISANYKSPALGQKPNQNPYALAKTAVQKPEGPQGDDKDPN